MCRLGCRHLDRARRHHGLNGVAHAWLRKSIANAMRDFGCRSRTKPENCKILTSPSANAGGGAESDSAVMLQRPPVCTCRILGRRAGATNSPTSQAWNATRCPNMRGARARKSISSKLTRSASDLCFYTRAVQPNKNNASNTAITSSL